MDAPTYRGPFKNIETDGYPSQHECYPFSGNAINTVECYSYSVDCQL